MTYNVFGGTLSLTQSIVTLVSKSLVRKSSSISFSSICLNVVNLLAYSIKTRTHNKHLITNTTELNERHLLVRALYESIYSGLPWVWGIPWGFP